MGASGSKPLLQADKHVVIIGGGYGGLLLAHKLMNKRLCKVTLIDPKDCMVHYVAALRSSVNPAFAKKIFIPYDRVLGDSFVRGKVTAVEISIKRITLESGKQIDYTDLVIATGASSPFPGKITSRKEDVSAAEGIQIYKDFNQEIAKSKRVLIIGGGAVGLEMAGEVRTEFPSSEVTVVNSRPLLVSPRTNEAFQTRLKDELLTMKIKVILDDKVENVDELVLNKNQNGQKVTTTKGLSLETDLIIPCVGNKVQTEFLKSSLGGSMTDSGALVVNGYLQVKGHDNVYAIGDCTNVDEEKMAFTAKLQATFLAANLERLAKNSALKRYVPGDFIMVVPLGRNGGISQLKGMVARSFVTKMIKSKTLFVGPTWTDVGLKPA